MDRRGVLILTALQHEARALAGALGVRLGRGQVGSWKVELRVTGPRAGKLPTQLNAQVSPAVIVLAGLSAGLDPDLRCGDVVVEETGHSGLKLDLALLPPRVYRGPLHTAAEIIASPADKAALRNSTHAAAVDMETKIVRDWAGKLGVAFISIRAIADVADESLDAALLDFIDERGRTRPLRIARTLLARPLLLPHLIHVGRRSHRACKKLGQATRELLTLHEFELWVDSQASLV